MSGQDSSRRGGHQPTSESNSRNNSRGGENDDNGSRQRQQPGASGRPTTLRSSSFNDDTSVPMERRGRSLPQPPAPNASSSRVRVTTSPRGHRIWAQPPPPVPAPPRTSTGGNNSDLDNSTLKPIKTPSHEWKGKGKQPELVQVYGQSPEPSTSEQSTSSSPSSNSQEILEGAAENWLTAPVSAGLKAAMKKFWTDTTRSIEERAKLVSDSPNTRQGGYSSPELARTWNRMMEEDGERSLWCGPADEIQAHPADADGKWKPREVSNLVDNWVEPPSEQPFNKMRQALLDCDGYDRSLASMETMWRHVTGFARFQYRDLRRPQAEIDSNTTHRTTVGNAWSRLEDNALRQAYKYHPEDKKKRLDLWMSMTGQTNQSTH